LREFYKLEFLPRKETIAKMNGFQMDAVRDSSSHQGFLVAGNLLIIKTAGNCNGYSLSPEVFSPIEMPKMACRAKEE